MTEMEIHLAVLTLAETLLCRYNKSETLIKPTENKIIAGCKAQDPLLQKELVLRYSGSLMTVCRRYTRDNSMAKDVLQEGLIKIFKAIPKYQATGSFEGWMKKIVINTALQKQQKKSYYSELNGFEKMPEREIAPDIYGRLNANELIQLIDRLPDGFREIFNLYAIEGFSHGEIAELLNISESTSRSQLSRARKILQKKLTQQEKISI